MTKIYILLSFDHELSLGGAASYDRNLFEPTAQLLDLADELSVPITLFTDVCCALRFREWDSARFYQPYEKQIAAAIRRGHDAQLHLHPHWLDSHYAGGRFTPATTYSLGDFEHRAWPDNIPGIVARGIELLEHLCAADEGYRCIAYRAGGFSLEPGSAAVLSALFDHGIRIESTIAKDFRFGCDLWQVDFREMPEPANWWISPTGPINAAAQSGLYEIPIAARPRTPLNNLPFLFHRVTRRWRQYDSGGWSIDTGHVTAWEKLKRLVPRSAWMLSFDQFADNVSDLMKTLDYHITRHNSGEFIACSAISHPKFMGSYARHLMRDFVERVRQKFGSQVTFCSYQEFYQDVLERAQPSSQESVHR